LLWEEGMTLIKVQSALLVPHIFYFVTTMKLHMELGKISKHYTNYGKGNHNVKMRRVKKKKEPTITTIEATNQTQSEE